MFLVEVVRSKGHVSVQALPPSMGDGNVRAMTSTLISATMNPVPVSKHISHVVNKQTHWCNNESSKYK